MSPRRLFTLRRSALAAAIAAIGISITGCATSNHPVSSAGGQDSGLEAADSNNDGGYVQANGVTYQLQVSRQLNQYATEDSQYLKGLPAGTANPTGQQMWYGVFLWAKNQQPRPYTTTDNFEIKDTQDNTYYPVKLNATDNPFAWTPQLLGTNETEPGQDTAAAMAFTQGKLVLFKLPTSVYDNRPLTLYILDAQHKPKASISLDL